MKLSELKKIEVCKDTIAILNEDDCDILVIYRCKPDKESHHFTDKFTTDCLEFYCPICNSIIMIDFTAYFTLDCKGKFINPYMVSICKDCKRDFDHLLTLDKLSEWQQEKFDNYMIKLGFIQPPLFRKSCKFWSESWGVCDHIDVCMPEIESSEKQDQREDCKKCDKYKMRVNNDKT